MVCLHLLFAVSVIHFLITTWYSCFVLQNPHFSHPAYLSSILTALYLVDTLFRCLTIAEVLPAADYIWTSPNKRLLQTLFFHPQQCSKIIPVWGKSTDLGNPELLTSFLFFFSAHMRFWKLFGWRQLVEIYNLRISQIYKKTKKPKYIYSFWFKTFFLGEGGGV